MRHQNERDLPVKLVLVNLSHNPSEMTYLYDDDHHHIRVGHVRVQCWKTVKRSGSRHLNSFQRVRASEQVEP